MLEHIRRDYYERGFAASRKNELSMKLPAYPMVTELPYDFSLKNRLELEKEINGRRHIWVTANRICIQNSAGDKIAELRGNGPDFPWLSLDQ